MKSNIRNFLSYWALDLSKNLFFLDIQVLQNLAQVSKPFRIPQTLQIFKKSSGFILDFRNLGFFRFSFLSDVFLICHFLFFLKTNFWTKIPSNIQTGSPKWNLLNVKATWSENLNLLKKRDHGWIWPIFLKDGPFLWIIFSQKENYQFYLKKYPLNLC